ncbi:phosphocholine-specific phospholipase C [Edaphobacter flagellatus]|uniref:phosphocholine-specific phospholipase C n=1 Tax=Edaphobacter flagellatus TaxID=1933044 RepID=UPI0021B2E55D|nr:phospholipase C, phosphocholine-specific [Edaphobacter flagellatus]
MKSRKSRRDFLRMAMTSAAGAAAGARVFPASISKALSIPANHVSGTIKDVEHVVILMQENRSFDHYFGTLKGVRGFNDPRPVRLPNGKPIWYQPPATVHTSRYHSRGLRSDAPYVLPFYLNPKATTEFSPGTDHGWSSGHLAWNHGKHNQWVNQKQDVVTMGYLKREDVSFHYALADAFTICDAYHCSIHSNTAPNRIYLWSGTIDPRNVYGSKPNGPGMGERGETNGYTWTTYPERLEAHGVSWKLYQGGSGEPGTPTDNYTDNSLEFFAQYQVKEGASPSSPLVMKGVSNYTLREFREDVVKNRLSHVSWIVAPYKYSEHPEACPSDGAYYINLVLEALTANPDVWSKTVFFINYDENDGQFDHIVPPMPPLTSEVNAQGMVSKDLLESLGDEILDLDKYPDNKRPLIPNADPGGLQPIGLGPRVPMLIISPWTTGGWVCSQVFDHTSVLRFLEARFDIPEPNISTWRRSLCGDLTSAFNFSSPPEPGIPHFVVPKLIVSQHRPYHVPDVQSMPKQEPGVRKARALPYEFFVHARLRDDETDAVVEKVWIDFANTGEAGGGFYVYNGMKPDDNPRRYSISAGDNFSDYWSTKETNGAYDLSAYGPNGSHCHFRGNVEEVREHGRAHPEVKVRYDITKGNVSLALTNYGSSPCTFRVMNTYTKSAVRTYKVVAGASVDDHWDLASSSSWYDLSVAVAEMPNYLRRFAGHIETRRPSTSDPAIFEETTL